jgi:hypothetical protein
MRRRRRRHRAAELTPLIDVLFILLFAALLQARTAVERGVTPADAIAEAQDAGADASASDAGADASAADASAEAGIGDAGGDAAVADAGPSEHLAQSREIAARLASAVENHDVFVVEVTGDGHVTSMTRWSRGQEVRRDRVRDRLVRPVLPGESRDEFVYLGVKDRYMRVCPVVREHFELPAEAGEPYLVMVLLDVPVVDLPLSLHQGLKDDLKTCFADATGVGILLEPGEENHGIP